MIPMVNIETQYAEIKDEVESGLTDTIAECSFILGSSVQAFENEAAEYLRGSINIQYATGF